MLGRGLSAEAGTFGNGVDEAAQQRGVGVVSPSGYTTPMRTASAAAAAREETPNLLKMLVT